MFIANRKELEKKFPLQSDDVIQSRIQRITIELENLGYRMVGEFDGMIRFEKRKDGYLKGVCSFGVWQIEHETDDDFDFGFRKHLLSLKEKKYAKG